MYKVEILGNDIQQAAIQRRKKLDSDRKNRIFDPQLRTKGVRYRRVFFLSNVFV